MSCDQHDDNDSAAYTISELTKSFATLIANKDVSVYSVDRLIQAINRLADTIATKEEVK